MKKIIGLAIGAVAVLALSGCNAAGDQGLNKIDILDLHNGYAVIGYDNINGNSMEIDFCGNKYDYYKGTTTYSGTFNIKDSIENDSRVNFFDSRPGVTYRIDTDVDANAGKLEVGETYNIYKNFEYITISSIRKDTAACY